MCVARVCKRDTNGRPYEQCCSASCFLTTQVNRTDPQPHPCMLPCAVLQWPTACCAVLCRC
jgi:hypothetical protein